MILFTKFVERLLLMKTKLLFIFLFSFSVFAGNAIEKYGETQSQTPSQTSIVLGQNFPNPAKSKTEIKVEFTGTAVLKIYNILGKQVEVIVLSEDKKVIVLDVSDYQEGIYLYSIESGNQKVTKRMTVRK